MVGSSYLAQAEKFAALLSERLETSRARVITAARYNGAPDNMPDAILIALELRPEFIGKVNPQTDGLHQENDVMWAISRASDENFWWDDLKVADPYLTATTYAVWCLNDTPAISRAISAAKAVRPVSSADRARVLDEIGAMI